MLEPNYIALFFAVVLFLITPGVGVAILIARTITAGMKTAFMIGFAMILTDVGYALLVLLALEGIASYITPYLYYVRLFGAGYLVYIGFMQMQQGKLEIKTEKEKLSYLKAFLFGAMISLTNPKVIVFYIGFFPLFVPVGNMDTVSIICTAFVVFLGSLIGLWFILLSGKWLKKILTSHRAGIANKTIGMAMILFGVLLVV